MKTNDLSVKKKTKKRLWIESIMILFIVASPFVFKAHDYFSREPDATVNFLGLTIDSNGFNNLNAFAWFFVSKFIPLYLLIIWFMTCKHWWYHILIIPVCMYAFQLFEVIISPDLNIDTKNVLWLLPICMVVIPFVYFIRIKIYDKYVHGIDLEALDAELKSYGLSENTESIEMTPRFGTKHVENNGESDLSDETPKRTLQQIFSGLRMSLRSLF